MKRIVVIGADGHVSLAALRWLADQDVSFGQYLEHPEAKSLAPDGTACTRDTTGMLRRASIVAGEVVPIGKETDRHWEQGEDPSMVDFKVPEYHRNRRMAIATLAQRKEWARIGVRPLLRKTGLSQKVVYAILQGRPVKKRTMAMFSTLIDRTA